MSKVDYALKLEFASRKAFRDWLTRHGATHDGIWIISDKSGKKPGVSYAEALEEVLCFGWIDGTIKSIDANTYMRYFARRNEKSFFSEKNRGLIDKLIANGKMTPLGMAGIERAKQAGHYQEKINDEPTVADEEALLNLLRQYDGIYELFMAMPKSSRKIYLAHYHAAKSEETRQRRLARMVVRIKLGLPLP